MADRTGIVARTVAALRYAATGQTPNEWFGPGRALPDQAPPEVKGRAYDFPYYANLNYQPRNSEPVNFKKLKALAQTCEPLKIVIGRQRDLVRAREWTIKPKVKEHVGGTPDPMIAKISTFFEMPDRKHDWSQWISAVLDQLFVYDAVSIYSRQTLGGELYALEAIDGSTITPLLDAWGRQPDAPEPAYKQIIKGLPAVSYTTDELIYYPENYRVDHIYGYSRVEQIVDHAETVIARLRMQKGYFTHGNMGDGYFTAPPGMNPDQLKAVEASWNAMMSADGGTRIAERRIAMFLPNGIEWNPTKIDVFEELFDEWLIRIICFPFGVSPSPFLKQAGIGKGSSDTDKEQAEEAGISQLLKYIQRLMNRIIATKFLRPDLEFSWIEDNEIDPKTKADIEDIRLKNRTLTRNEVRDRNGDAPVEGGDDFSETPPANPLMQPGQNLAAGKADAIDANADTKTKPEEPSNAGGKNAAEKLAKAVPAAAEAKMAATVAKFLKARAEDAVAGILASLALEKVDPMDDYSGRVEGALTDIAWDWTPLVEELEPIMARVAVAAGNQAYGKLGLFDADVLKKLTANAAAWAHERAAELVGMRWVGDLLIINPDTRYSIVETTRKALRSLVANAISTGASNQDLAKQIREAAAFSKERAMVIARTETASADVQGNLIGWRESGVVAGKQWLTDPEQCCDECIAYDGTIVAIDDDFGDGDPPLHPNCRCTVLPVLTEEMPDA